MTRTPRASKQAPAPMVSGGDSPEFNSTRALLERLVNLPDLAPTLRALPPQAFAALVRRVGVADAGELVALATTEQLVQAFDEDLFVADHAGERETLDVDRFVQWLEVLLEAGDEVAAERFSELDEDFIAHALSTLVLVLDEDALRQTLDDSDEDDAEQADKALESALSEDLDGYLLVAKQPAGWDAALALVLALDRNHRALLVRLLKRLSHLDSHFLDDLEQLSTLLSEGESLAEDVEAAREQRRSEQGYVEPRAARAFLTLARRPLEQSPPLTSNFAKRDPLTKAYFREVSSSASARPSTALRGSPADAVRNRAALDALPLALGQALESSVAVLRTAPPRANLTGTFMNALRDLNQTAPQQFGERMAELAYLVNVLLAGHQQGGERLRPNAAADAVISTVCFGAVLVLRSEGKPRPAQEPDFSLVLREWPMDYLFRLASGALAAGAAPSVASGERDGLLYSTADLERALR